MRRSVGLPEMRNKVIEICDDKDYKIFLYHYEGNHTPKCKVSV